MVGNKKTLPTLHGYMATWLRAGTNFFNEDGGQQKDVAHPTWLSSM
ncbi:hypothetical protein QUF54_06265 [Candidatus Marithioploca araucensis]|uniref:Uncharacterized protein n=1 Tax=Candidatus Marithioploca araucensis TaxID=70273 RepID=A0ABT7VTN5_9GAMM|nr:hypothetical protein [Candidatus Marithioploca araucensis]